MWDSVIIVVVCASLLLLQEWARHNEKMQIQKREREIEIKWDAMLSKEETRYDEAKARWDTHTMELMEAWAKERKDLMDRIQAPTFAEYANKVVREKKAEQPQEEEKPIEFVS